MSDQHKEIETTHKAGQNVPRPNTLTEAYSEIQKLWGIEQGGGKVYKEYLTLSDFTGFANIGIQSAVKDTILFIILSLTSSIAFYFLEGYYLQDRTTEFLFFKLNGHPYYWISQTVSLFRLFGSTIICVMMGRYYIGNITRRAIQGVWIARYSYLFFCAFLCVYVLGLLFNHVLSEPLIMKMATFMAKTKYSYGSITYDFLYYLKAETYKISMTMIGISALSFLLIVCTWIFFAIKNREDKELGLDDNL